MFNKFRLSLLASSLFVFLFIFLFFSPSKSLASQLEVPSQYSTIQSAIDAAQAGDVVNVAAGTYNEAINFLGKEISVQGAGADVSILDGAGLQSSVVRAVSGETINTVLEGFTVTNGEGSFGGYSSIRRTGGGLQILYSSITARSLKIENNSVQWFGGAIFIWESPNTIMENVEILNNSGQTIVDIENYSNVTFRNSKIHSNQIATNVVLSMWRSWGTFENVEFTESTSSIIEIFYNNGWYGDPDTPVRFNKVLIHNNDINGSVINIYDGRVIVEKSEISHNSTSDSIISFQYGQLDVFNSTITDNQTYSNLDWENSVITFGTGDSTSRILIDSTIIWNNFSPNGIAIPFPGSSDNLAPTYINYSIIQGGWTDPNSVGIINTDPLFVDSANGDYHLTSVSPAIDSGDPSSPLDPDGTRADMGAYPFFYIPLAPTEQLNNLISLVQTFNLQQGITNSLDAKLDAAVSALDDINASNNQAAINSLQAFINAVEAQRGNKITNEQADQLIHDAQLIIDNLSSS